MEDVDRTRARADLERSIREDLEWLGILWDEETPPQRMRPYESWVEGLRPSTYLCACTRADLAGSPGYPGTCRDAGRAEGALRFRVPPGPVAFTDRRWGPRTVDPGAFGDPVLRRRDGAWSYTLAVVVDDLCDGVTEVVRGADLLDYTGVQIRLWEALGATPPTWLHTPLLLGADGKKLSKSHGSTEVAALRSAGWTARRVWSELLPLLGLRGHDDLAAAAASFDPQAGELGPVTIPYASSR